MVASGNVGLAFGLSIAAGMATALGAACVLFGSLCKPRILAGSLGFAAGVMIYVSFVEIFSAKAIGAFVANGSSDAEAVRYATGCFFLGVLVVYILDAVVHGITALAVWIKKREIKTRAVTSLKRLLSRKSMAPSTPSDVPAVATPVALPAPADPEMGDSCPATHLPPSDASQEPTKQHANSMHHLAHRMQQAMCTTIPSPPSSAADNIDAAEAAAAAATAPADGSYALPVPRDPDVLRILQDDHHQAALMKTGVLTAIAIFAHNFPEGLATFVATLADPSVGISVAFAIALHNAVEGVCVALPIYYATGSKWKGFFWGVVSGLTEPLGALMGWLILYNPSQLAFGIVFGIVGGMMVCISLKELVPTALRYDPNQGFVMAWLFLGMVVMAGSLLLFAL